MNQDIVTLLFCTFLLLLTGRYAMRQLPFRGVGGGKVIAIAVRLVGRLAHALVGGMWRIGRWAISKPSRAYRYRPIRRIAPPRSR